MNSPWKRPGQICELFNMTPDHLRHLRMEDLREGFHYRSIGRRQAARPTYRYHSDRIEKYLNTKVAERF